MLNDPTLRRLEMQRDDILREQAKLSLEITHTRDRLRDELDKVNRDWGGKVTRLEHTLQSEQAKLPNLMREIERQREKLVANDNRQK